MSDTHTADEFWAKRLASMREDIAMMITRFQHQNVLQMSDSEKIEALRDALWTLTREVETEAGWTTAEAVRDGTPLYDAVSAANLLLGGLGLPHVERGKP